MQRVQDAIHGVECEVCGQRFTSRTRLDVHMQRHRASEIAKKKSGNGLLVKPTQMTNKVWAQAGEEAERSAGPNKRTFEPPALCPDCGQQCSTITVLTKHFLRKHVDGAAFKCAKCDKGFNTKSDRTRHESVCLRGPDAGKVIRCLACQMVHKTAWAWATHMDLTKHKLFELCWPDGSTGPAPPPTSAAGQLVAPPPEEFGTVLDDEAAAALEAQESRIEDEAEVVHIGRLEVLEADGRVPQPARGTKRKV